MPDFEFQNQEVAQLLRACQYSTAMELVIVGGDIIQTFLKSILLEILLPADLLSRGLRNMAGLITGGWNFIIVVYILQNGRRHFV